MSEGITDIFDEVSIGHIGMYRDEETLKPIDYIKKLPKNLKEKGISFLNIEQAMLTSDKGPFFPKNGEPHFNENGHSFTADKLFDHLLNQGFID